MTSPLSQDRAKAVLHYAMQLSNPGFWGKLSETHLDARPGLSAALGRELKFAPANTIAAICRNCNITLEELCHSGLLKVRITATEQDTRFLNDIPADTPPEQRPALLLAKQKELITAYNEGLNSLVLGEPMTDKNGALLTAPNYAGDILAPVVGVHPPGTNINNHAAQDDLHNFELHDGLYLDMSALKALAEGRASDAPQQQVGRAR